MTTIPLSSITIHDRVRRADTPDTLNHIQDLADSIIRFGGYPTGLLQPPIVDQNNVLLAGWCRYSAAKLLGWTDLPVLQRESLSAADYEEVELEENFRRLNLSWDETVRSVCRIHRKRYQSAALHSEKWTQAMTGELLGGYSDSYVSNCLAVEPHLDKPAFKDLTTITDAVKQLHREKEDEAVAIQAQRISATFQPNDGTPFDNEPPFADLEGNPTPTNAEAISVSLSTTVFHGDSIRDILPRWPEACVDHVITDWPFAIDIDMMDQDTAGVNDSSRIRSTHEIDENLALQQLAVKEIYRVLKPGGFFLCWHDAMWFRWTHDLGVAAGFGVQRWPLVGCKPSGGNSMANTNITKATEQVIVMRKGVATLPSPVAKNWFFMPPPVEKLSNPFAKSYEAWAFLIEAVSIQGQIILDPFAGEGTCPLACLNLYRKPIAIEKDPTHFPYLLTSIQGWWKNRFPNVVFT